MTIQVPSASKRSETLNKVIDKVLNQILGQEATQIIYDYLENNHSIQRHEIAQKLDSFNKALTEYLGTGAVVIERGILENLEIRGPEEIKSVDLAEQLRTAKMA